MNFEPTYNYPHQNYPKEYWNTTPRDKIQAIILPETEIWGLYIGNLDGAGDPLVLKRFEIVSVLTTASQCPINYGNVPQVCFHYVIPAQYDKDSDIFQYFDEAYRFIEDKRQIGNVLVHCFSGANRSAAFVLAYMIKKYNCSIEKAYELIKIQSPYAQISSNYMKQLLRYEQHLNFIKEIEQKKQEKLLMKKESNDQLIKKDEKKTNYINELYKRNNFQLANELDIKNQIEQQEKWLLGFKLSLIKQK